MVYADLTMSGHQREDGARSERGPGRTAGFRRDGGGKRAMQQPPMEQDVSFGRYRFDASTGRLWSRRREVRLTPKAAAVLAVLVARAGKPVTRDELFASVWGGTVVGDDALTSCIQELREALADDAKQPRYIETRHRRGYRFVARLVSSTPDEPSRGPASPAHLVLRPPPLVVGRERELRELRACLDRAMGGERQIVFVTGEPGIGKTAVVEAFLRGTRRATSFGSRRGAVSSTTVLARPTCPSWRL